MAFRVCRCGHYDDAHFEGMGSCAFCRGCPEFKGMGDSVEGTNIYEGKATVTGGKSEDIPFVQGYHSKPIKRGKLGEISKIQEELDELKDAEEQQLKVMQLVELSDLMGAINAYVGKHHPGIRMEDLSQFSQVTERAFRNGFRKARE